MFHNQRGRANRDSSKEVRVATHLDVIKMCIAIQQPKYIIEHGMGISSTPFFHSLEKVETILSYENEPRWQSCDKCPSNIKHVILGKPKSWKDSISEVISDFDFALALVDGPGRERFYVVEACVELQVPFIVEHDAETMTKDDVKARKDLLEKQGYFGRQFVMQNPETALYTKIKLDLNESKYLPF